MDQTDPLSQEGAAIGVADYFNVIGQSSHSDGDILGVRIELVEHRDTESLLSILDPGIGELPLTQGLVLEQFELVGLAPQRSVFLSLDRLLYRGKEQIGIAFLPVALGADGKKEVSIRPGLVLQGVDHVPEGSAFTHANTGGHHADLQGRHLERPLFLVEIGYLAFLLRKNKRTGRKEKTDAKQQYLFNTQPSPGELKHVFYHCLSLNGGPSKIPSRRLPEE